MPGLCAMALVLLGTTAVANEHAHAQAQAGHAAAAKSMAGHGSPHGGMGPAEGAMRPAVQRPVLGASPRHELRGLIGRARTYLNAGQLSAAAMSLPIAQDHALHEINHDILNRAIKMAHQASKKGDVMTAADALEAIKAVRETTELGWWQRFRVWRATRAAVKNAQKKVRYFGRRLNMNAAAQNVAFLVKVLKEDHPKTRDAIKDLHKYAMKTAKHHARQGSPPEATQSLEIARYASTQGGPAFDERKAEEIMRFANKRAASAWTWQARIAYKKGEHAQAAALLVEVENIEKQYGFRPGFFARRQQRKYTSKLGPHMAQAREQRAAQMRAQEEERLQAHLEQMESAAARQRAAGTRGQPGGPDDEAIDDEEEIVERAPPRPRAPLAPFLRSQPQPGPGGFMPQRPMPSAVEVVEPVGVSPFSPGPG